MYYTKMLQSLTHSTEVLGFFPALSLRVQNCLLAICIINSEKQSRNSSFVITSQSECLFS